MRRLDGIYALAAKRKRDASGLTAVFGRYPVFLGPLITACLEYEIACARGCAFLAHQIWLTYAAIRGISCSTSCKYRWLQASDLHL
jgi:hypothetical protein